MKAARKWLLVLGVCCSALVAVVLVNAGLLQSRQIIVDPAPALAFDRAAAAKRFAGSLTFQTISRQNPSHIDQRAFLELHDYLVNAFPKAHQTLTREVVSEYSLVYTWPGKESGLAPILLLGHLDVVPVEPVTEHEWTHAPFAGTIAEGYVWGRGAMDFKMAIAGTLEAIEALLMEGFTPRRTVILAFGHDEEIGGQNGAQHIAALLERRGVQPDMILDEGLTVILKMVPGITAPVACVGIAEKGYASLELIATAEGGHSSMPPRHTAVGILASAIHALEAHPMPGHLDGSVGKMFEYLAPEMPIAHRLVLGNLWLFGGLLQYQLDHTAPTAALIRTTLAATMLEGSIKENILPTRARAVVNVRVHPSDQIEEVMHHVQTIVANPRITVQSLPGTVSEPSPESPIETPSFRLLQRTIAQHFPDAIVAPGLVLGATDSRHYRTLSPNVYRFMPIRVTREDTVRIHGIDERLAVEEYGTAVAFYGQLIRNAGL